MKINVEQLSVLYGGGDSECSSVSTPLPCIGEVSWSYVKRKSKVKGKRVCFKVWDSASFPLFLLELFFLDFEWVNIMGV